MRRFVVVLAFLLALLSIGCENPFQEYPYYNPSGTVYGPDGKPMAGATITFNDGETLTTKEDGKYQKKTPINWRCDATPTLEGMVFSPDKLFFMQEHKEISIQATNAEGSTPELVLENAHIYYNYNGSYPYEWKVDVKNKGNGFGEFGSLTADIWEVKEGPPVKNIALPVKGLPPGGVVTFRGYSKPYATTVYEGVFMLKDKEEHEVFRVHVKPE